MAGPNGVGPHWGLYTAARTPKHALSTLRQTTNAGVVRQGTWYLDYNGNTVFEGCNIDRCFAFGGDPGDLYVEGRW